MRNRAKCKLCGSIIESFTIGDYVSCKCGEIAIAGGNQRLDVFAKDFANLLRVDDLGNEIIVKVVDPESTQTELPSTKPNREELLKMLDEMVKNIENLPSAAMQTPINHYDFCSALLLLSSILRA